MRLAITFQGVDPSRGGAETYVADLCRALVALGHDVDLFASRWDARALPARVACHLVPAEGRTRWGRIWGFARNSEAALKSSTHDCSIGFINTWHQDILIPQGGVHAASLEANARRFAAGWRRRLYVAAKRAHPKSWWLYRAIESRQYDPARGTRVVAVSAMVRSHLQRFHRVSAGRIRVIPNAIDADRLAVGDPRSVRAAIRARHGLAEGDLTGLFVGHNFRLKGLYPLLDTMAMRLRQAPSARPIHLLVCGGGKMGPLRQRVDRLGLSRYVHLVGFAPEVKDYYHAADFFALPSYYDPCSLVVFEALACGLPVITTECNGAGELIEQGREGFVIPRPDDSAAMVAALDRMCDDPGRAAMSRRAVDLGRAQSFDRHVSRLLELCEEVAASKAQQRREDPPSPRGVDPDASHRPRGRQGHQAPALHPRLP